MSKRINPNTTDLAKGDQFAVQYDVSFADASAGVGPNAVKLTDCTVVHEVDKNGQKFVQSEITWYGLNDTGVAGVKDSLAQAGIKPGKTTVTGFQGLVNEWRKITKMLGTLNDHGDAAVKALNL
jgi:hypothetical protein